VIPRWDEHLLNQFGEKNAGCSLAPNKRFRDGFWGKEKTRMLSLKIVRKCFKAWFYKQTICKLKSLFFNPFKSIVQSAQTHFAFPNSRHASTHTTCQDLMGDVKVMDTNNTARTWSFNVFLFFFFFAHIDFLITKMLH